MKDIGWDFIIESSPLHFFVELTITYDNEQLYCILLGKHVTTVIIEYDSFLTLSHVHVTHCVAEYSIVTRRMIRCMPVYELS